jgi:hypothetical protein
VSAALLSDFCAPFAQGHPFRRMIATSTRLRPPVPVPGRKPAMPLVESLPRQQLLDQASKLFDQAATAAEAGNVADSAQLILKALDCERRAGGVGPQVLQLIKPRV